MECREILLVVWKGEIPIQFVLEADELSGVETPDPFFLLAPRITYLPLVTEKVLQFMIRAIIRECNWTTRLYYERLYKVLVHPYA